MVVKSDRPDEKSAKERPRGLPCPPGKKTDDPQGRCCVFPFEYGGVTYQSCTNGWCSFDEVYVGNWANCGKE
ncbi:hypothetical protein pdam_00022921 [Pocillopora damicornis]|uniref:Fibronectin type-II domain-containing protein n=1 Tax=Pocillopora damicornis TaxID=46731 RepID=A0A3M6UZH6_POCDA|nr:hypothetical protein pdam_00022921 [Pocillopora damicornis]